MGWVGYQMHKQGRGASFLKGTSVAMLILIALVSPWFVRNYRAFHRFIPFRDNLWLELRVGNNGDTSDAYIDWTHPAHNPLELQEYRRLGESAYFDQKKIQVLTFIRRHPGMFLWLTVKRITFTWTGFWSLRRQYLANEPFEIPNVLLSTTLLILMGGGLRRAWRSMRQQILPLLFCLLTLPAVYYVTHVDANYRHPIDPEIILFSVYGVAARRRATT
jgi:hypothetical protein